MRNSFKKAVAVFLMLTLVIPSAFFAVPPKAQAIGVTVLADISLQTAFQMAKDALIEINTFTSKVAETFLYVNAFVLQPLAFILSGRLMQMLTSGVIAFVTGAANGTGEPQFVQNLQGNLQRVGDTQALAFFAQFGRNSNSPFATSIVSALRINYLQQTSMAGFWAANKSTLALASPNVNAFLAGDWSQGGVKAWFALTTQPQNNPYLLYQNSRSQLANVVGNAQATRVATLNWGQGFLSWCGPTDSSGSAPSPSNPGDADQQLANAQAGSAVGANPGDPCIQSDSTPGLIRTPGSVISASLNKVLGGAQDKLAGMGSLASEVNSIMGNIATVFQTINLAANILNGPNGGGLIGAGTAAASASQSATFLGANSGAVYQNQDSNQAQFSNPSTNQNQSSATQNGGAPPLNTGAACTTTTTDVQFTGTCQQICAGGVNAGLSKDCSTGLICCAPQLGGQSQQ